MDKTITTVLLIIVAVVTTAGLSSAILPAVNRSSSAVVSANSVATDKLKTDIEIVAAVGDTAATDIFFWVKNLGTTDIQAIDKSDVFLTTPTTLTRLPYNSGAEYWTYALEGSATRWTQAETIKVTLSLLSLPTGSYKVKMIVPNGVIDELEFTVD